MAATAHIRNRTGMDVEVMWGDEGFVVGFRKGENPPPPALLIPDVDAVEALVVRQRGSTSLFAARFGEPAARPLLPRGRRPELRTPLWQQRKRASDLLAVASRFGSFPALLETYREVLRDHFDMPALVDTLRKIGARTLRVATIDSRVPSPFAASLLFSYVANFIYDGDSPLAERRAQALAVDQAQLRELLGEAEMRELLDARAIEEHEHGAQRLKRPAHGADGLHDLLLALGDLSEAEIRRRFEGDPPLEQLFQERRVFPVNLATEKRWVAAEDAARWRDALGVPPPPGLPRELLEPVKDPLGDLVSRWARTHGPFHAEDLAARWGLGVAVVREALQRLAGQERVLEGEFLPGGRGREWIDAEVLKALKRRSLARLRKQVEPVEPAALARFLMDWQGIARPRRGIDPVLSAV